MMTLFTHCRTHPFCCHASVAVLSLQREGRPLHCRMTIVRGQLPPPPLLGVQTGPHPPPCTPIVSTPPCVHTLSSSGSPLLPTSCRRHPQVAMEGLERYAGGGHWLMTMKRRVAEKNADNNDHAVLLPLSLPSPSLAHVVAEVLLVRTLFDTPLLIPPSSSALPPTHLFGC